MSIQDMINDIEKDAQEDVVAARDRAKAESTKALISKADQWESFYQDKKDKLRIQLERREASLKAEKDFSFRTANIVAEDKFAESLLPFIHDTVLSFVDQNLAEYLTILDGWFNQVLSVLEGELTVTINPRDISILKPYQSKITSIIEDSSLVAGIIVSSSQGVRVDLSFETLYADHKDQLQNLVMKELKENIR
ncbi:MAG: hypothetical protein ACRCY4_04925 [Brevinema sp.]